MAHTPHPLATLSQIVAPPSLQDGIPKELELELRIGGCMMIQEAGIMLGLPQSTMATAQVIFHRFFYVSSMFSFGVNDISISSLYLSSKLNETPLRLRDLINTYMFLTGRIKHLLSFPPDQPLPLEGMSIRDKGKGKEKVWEDFEFEIPPFQSEVFWEWKDVIVVSEIQILKRLGFNMQVDLPYNHVVNYCKILDLVQQDQVVQTCWSILNDALLTPLYTHHPPHVLACTSILLTTRLLRIPLPENWFLLFDVDYEDLVNAAGHIVALWKDWGTEAQRGVLKRKEESGADRIRRENRWRRVWILAQGRREVRRWVQDSADVLPA
ncbi:cyclin L, partial [Tremellales sp. Uapishka_1]